MSPDVRYWRESEHAGPHSYYEMLKVMPRIPDVHLQSVVFIYPSVDAAQRGVQAGGSGFVISYPSGTGWNIRYVVTNKHVFDNNGIYVRLNYPHGRGFHVVGISADLWTEAPGEDDFVVAVLPLPDAIQPYELTLNNPGPIGRLDLTREEATALHVGPGDEAYMVGRFVAHGGRVSNNPIARFGSIALMPNPAELVRDGRGKDVEAYLIEMRSHAGFSGSPVFLLIPANSFRGDFGFTDLDDNVTRFRLLGIDTGHMVDPLDVQRHEPNGWVKIPDTRVAHYTDVSIVSPIWKVVDLLEREDMAEERRRAAAEMEKVRGSLVAVSDVATDASEPAAIPEMAKADFEDALRKVSRRKPSQSDE